MVNIFNQLCDVCTEDNAKYTCPGCSVHTCSLSCVRRHKEEKQCDGKRNKAAFVAKSDFTEAHLRSDIYFLEDLKNHVEQSKKDNRSYEGRDYSIRIKELLTFAKSRDVYIELMPKQMSRHQQNTTVYDSQKKMIHWRVEWKFPEENLSFTDERLPDMEVVQDVVDRHLKEHQEQMTLTQAEEDLARPYREQGGRCYCVLFKLYGTQKFCLLDKAASLQENLAGKRVVEFPSLFVVRCLDQYHILSQDEERQEMEKERPTYLTSYSKRFYYRARKWSRSHGLGRTSLWRSFGGSEQGHTGRGRGRGRGFRGHRRGYRGSRRGYGGRAQGCSGNLSPISCDELSDAHTLKMSPPPEPKMLHGKDPVGQWMGRKGGRAGHEGGVG